MKWLTKERYSYIDIFFVSMAGAAISDGNHFAALCLFIIWCIVFLLIERKNEN
jgi:hypothetical protein